MRTRPAWTARNQHGLTIVEIVVTIVILGIALVGVALMVRFGTQSGANVMLEARVVALGQAYLDEILGRRFDERSAASGLDPCFGFQTDSPTPPRWCTAPANLGRDGGSEPACQRERFDDVDDYHGLIEGEGAPTCTDIVDAEGDVRDNYENFRVEVDVRYAGNDPDWDWSAESSDPGSTPHVTHAKLITVTITVRGQDEGWKFSAYKGNY